MAIQRFYTLDVFEARCFHVCFKKLLLCIYILIRNFVFIWKYHLSGYLNVTFSVNSSFNYLSKIWSEILDKQECVKFTGT